jgi:hypothetical protein
MDIKQEKRWVWLLLATGWLVCCGLIFSSPSKGENTPITNDPLSDYIEDDSEYCLTPFTNGQQSDLESSAKPSGCDVIKGKEIQVDESQRLKNQEVLNQLYKNIKLYDSGVLNYDKKIN